MSGKEHYLHENQAWARALEYFQQENAYLKTRLSQLVDHSSDKSSVELAEHFQAQSIQNDEFIKDLSADVRTQLDLLKHSLEGSVGYRSLQKKQARLRNEMEHFEKRFAQMKAEFNQFLLSQL